MSELEKKSFLNTTILREIYVNEQLEGYKAILSYAQAAARGAFILNGGAAIALLSFSGNLLSKNTNATFDENLKVALFLFAAGIVCAALVTGFAYLTQYGYLQISYREQGRDAYFPYLEKTASCSQIVAMTLYAFSIISFCLGVYFSGQGLELLNQ